MNNLEDKMFGIEFKFRTEINQSFAPIRPKEYGWHGLIIQQIETIRFTIEEVLKNKLSHINE
jgi:hypothetical protein